MFTSDLTGCVPSPSCYQELLSPLPKTVILVTRPGAAVAAAAMRRIYQKYYQWVSSAAEGFLPRDYGG